MKTDIEWCDYSINPVKGLCPVACSYCYARRLYKRFKWNPEIRVDWQVTSELPNKSSRIFVGSTIELFGEWVKPEWMREIMQWPVRYPQHTFIFLTKQPQNLSKFSPFPPNCWVGVSVDNETRYREALNYLPNIKAGVLFASFEPLLTRMPEEGLINFLDWLIIGQRTPVSLRTMPKLGWVEAIVRIADRCSIPVFLKDNLLSCVDQYEFALKDGRYRQEMPNL
uniref:Radical SAM superfamily protein n=1 Tax=viral metagenome TaxID=1070528 RepID=A0A6M3JKQ5_9ZZZZ